MTIQGNHYDVAIVGAGPAGLQAALVLARTRKKLIVFDSPEPPRNSASHGVHNFLGLDGLLPAEIREQAWRQIDVYHSAALCSERIVAIQPGPHHAFSIRGENGTSITASQVILAVGFHDIYPNIPGFMACWGSTIIPCPFCDGYENRDRMWGLVASSALALEHMPGIVKNWTATFRLIVPPSLELNAAQRERFMQENIPVYEGEIVEVHHTSGVVEAATLNTGGRVDVETLWWIPATEPAALTRQIIERFSLELDENGAIKTNATYQTPIKGLWVVGDLRGPSGSLSAAHTANQAAINIVREWHG